MTTKKLHPDCEFSLSYKSLPEEEQFQHHLVWWWFQLLQMNQSYEEYCDAVRAKDHVEIDELKNSDPLLPDLYSDWEDVYSPDLRGMHDPSLVGFQKWLAKKSHLFFAPKVQWLTDDAVQWNAESIVIAIPNVGEASDKIKLVKDFLSKTQTNFPSSGIASMPKYQLRTKDHVKRYVTWANKASLVDDLFQFDDTREGVLEEHRQYSEEQIEELIIALAKDKQLKDHDVGFGWYRSSDGHYATKENIAQIKRLKSEFEEAICNTVKGIFPGRVEVTKTK